MLLEEHLPLVEVARRLEVHQSQLIRWKNEYLQTGEKDAFPGPGRQKAKDEELKRLHKELADAQEERDILKKTLAILSKTRAPSSHENDTIIS